MPARLLISILLSCSLVSATVAGTRYNSVSGSVRATATVVNPIGITEPSAGLESTDHNSLMVRFPSPDGVVISVEIDGRHSQTIRFDQPEGENFGPTHSFLDRDNLQLTPSDRGTIVITIYSTSQ